MGLSELGEVIYEAIEKCPFCSEDVLEVKEALYEIPHFGKILLHAHNCLRCGYKIIDFQHLEHEKAKKIIYLVEDGKDVMETLILRSKTCKICSPDLGFSLDPGQASEAFITTLEGLLYRVKDYATTIMILNDDKETMSKVKDFVDNIDYAIKGERRFTLILEDPMGNSIIKPPSNRENKLVIEKLESYTEVDY